MAGEAGERRDAAVRSVTDRLLVRWGLGRLDRSTESVIGRRVPGLLFDGVARAERLFVTTVPSFEYPRQDLPSTVRFVGPVLPPRTGQFDPPAWWEDLGKGQPVVLVTQGTMANGDLSQLVAPTLAALAREPLLVVATTGGRSPATSAGRISDLPPNARVETYVPYEQLLPHVSVMVTNGGFGAVQQALAAGVPLVVAGAGEDKPEVAARVAWSGAGVNLRTGRPSPTRLLQAVRRVLEEPAFRGRAEAFKEEMAGYRGVLAIADDLEEMVAQR
jgi:MGT family glycosyltransferase